MKTVIVFFSTLLFSFSALAQLKTTVKCPDFNIDILAGRINNIILPSSTIGQIKLNLPCFTSSQEEADTSNCGGKVFYKDNDVFFYTGRDYVEIGPAFKGKLSLPLMGASRNTLFQYLGAAQIKDITWDAFQTAYGVLILYYDKAEKVNKIRFSTQKATSIKLCDEYSR
jgi:hypothetical protein